MRPFSSSGGSTVYRIEIEPTALREISEEFERLRMETDRAPSWLEGLFAAIDSLDRHPQRCSLAPESAIFEVEIRQLLYGRRRHQRRILFSVTGQTVRILHVRHAARPAIGGA